MIWTLVVGIIVGLAGPIIGFIAAARLADRQQRHEVARDAAAAGREYAWRADEHFRPYLYDVLAAARVINEAASAHASDVGDIGALDRLLDRLESSPLTRDVAVSGSEMRSRAVDYRTARQMLETLNQQMPREGGPLRPDVGAEVVKQADEVGAIRDDVLAATMATREAVKRVVVKLEAQQRGEG